MDPFPPTEQQLRVIQQRGANLLIFAGPGTGKTETLARRFASLVVDDGIRPDQILVLTFSRRATHEMRDRVLLRLRQRLGSALAVSELFVKTFHSFCGRLLEGDGRGVARRLLTPVKERLLWRRVVRADAIELESLSPDVLASGQFATDCLNVITQLKGRGIDAKRLQHIAGEDKRLRDVAKIFDAMEGARQALQLRDFRDLVIEAVHALDDPESKVVQWLRAAAFRHILVDEFQDSDPIDLRLLEQIANVIQPSPCFCFVGDVNQSIYRFRGASPANILAAQTTFRCERMSLPDNRRSAPAILTVANADPQLEPSSLTSADAPNKDGSVVLERPRSIDDEVRVIVRTIAARIHDGLAPRAIAILLRQSFPYRELLVAALRSAGIPVAALPAAGFHEDGLIDAVLTALRLLAAPAEPQLWRRLLTNPIVGYRSLDVSNAFDSLRRHDGAATETDMLAALRRGAPLGPHPIASFLQAWNHCSEVYSSGDPRALVQRLVTELDLLRPVREPEPVPGFDAVASPARLQALLTAAEDYAETAQLAANVHSRQDAITEFIQRLDETIGLLADASEPPANIVDGVRVMSIHAAKGLEFEFVAIPQLIDGILPADERPNRILSARSIGTLQRSGIDMFSEAGLEQEEHSLWYVALTRAKSQVLVSAAQFDDDGVEQPLSPFVQAIPTVVATAQVSDAEPLLGSASAGNGATSQAIQQPALPGFEHAGGADGIQLDLDYLSPSSIDTFIACPRRFFYAHVLRLPKREDDDASAHGRLLHKILRRFHETETDFSDIGDPDSAAHGYARTLRALIADELRNAALASTEDSALLAFARHDLEVRLDMYAIQLADDASRHPFTVLACEQYLTSSFDGLTIQGQTDRVDRLVAGGLVIRDYKSGKMRATLIDALGKAFGQLDAGEVFFGDAPDGLSLQTILYIRGAQRLFGEPVRRIDYWYFRGKGGQKNDLLIDKSWISDDDSDGKPLTRADIARVEHDIARHIARLCNEGSTRAFATAKDEKVCRYCDYVSICPGVGAVVG